MQPPFNSGVQCHILFLTNQELCCIQLFTYCAALSELKLEFPVALIAIV